ncbi:putative disease resistance protein RGA1 [Pyrus communis]|uniref:putative disease resistance protein RGA1 n=1 Tax=Pyrus communis TaxID=23211 RepID=UPI0035BF699A
MVEAVPFGIATHLLVKLGSSTFQELGLIYGVDKELTKLESTLSTIRAVLSDAEEKQETSHLVQEWMRKLKDVVYRADNVFDVFETKANDGKDQLLLLQVRGFFSPSNHLAFRHKMGREIKEIRESLDEIAADISKFNFRAGSVTVYADIGLQNGYEKEETHSFVLPSTVIGRDKDKEEMVRSLMWECDRENVSIAAIVGIGGLGKTTLAKMLYNDERVVSYFQLKMWVWAYGNFDVRSIASKILSTGTADELQESEFSHLRNGPQKKMVMELEELQILLRKKLDGKLYLLVLDDVWNENRNSWLQLNDLLSGGAKGSKIVVTTRSTKVTSVMDIDSPYVLQGLREEECWTLFKKMAFRKGREDENPMLVPIGRRIADKCQGVPLAIRTLGSLMRYKTSESEWLAIQNKEIWEFPKEENDILAVLKLSYDHMPVYLKQCFSYCALFPKGYEIGKRLLIQLWIAQGYIHPPSKDSNLEDIGDTYFKELLWRSLLQEVKKDVDGNVISCNMHDLIQDLARAVAGSECSICNVDSGNVSERVHHVSFSQYLPSSWEVPTTLLKARKVRTFVLPLQYQTHKISTSHSTIISSLRCLRALDLHNIRTKELPDVIGKLTHLRYLDLSGNVYLVVLPGSICNLQNLQTLKLNRCYRLKHLPRNLGKMISLRHLEISGCCNLTHMPPGLGKLISLQTLPIFVLCKKSLSSSGLDELSGLNCLRGMLHIVHLEHVKNVTRGSNRSILSQKQCLQSLKLSWCREEDKGCNGDDILLEGLRPHQNLKALHIAGYCSVQFPNWLMPNTALSLPSLVEITIEGWSRCQHLPPFDQLPSLKFLKIYSLGSVEYINNGANCSSTTRLVDGKREALFFPSLKELVLYDLPLLKEWQAQIVKTDTMGTGSTPKHQSLSFPSLTKLTIMDTPSLLSMPMLPQVEELIMVNVTEKLLKSMVTVVKAALESPTASSSSSSTSPSSLAMLKFLRIQSCNDLMSLPDNGMQNLTSLELLEIVDCENLKSLPKEMHCKCTWSGFKNAELCIV